jgi:hypothetical protein
MGEMADRMQQLAEGDLEGTPSGEGAAPGSGTGGEGEGDRSSAGTSNTDRSDPPQTVPYSRFAEVNDRLRDLRPYERLAELGIEPEAAERLANFEAAYTQDPRGTITHVVDSIADLPDATKAAVKALLMQEAGLSDGDGASRAEGDGEEGSQSTAEMREVVEFVRNEKSAREQADRDARLDVVVNHWVAQDNEDGVKTSNKTRLTYIQAAAARGEGFQTLEELADVARKDWLEERDAQLGATIQTGRTGSPLRVPARGAVPSPEIVPKTMDEARKAIMADIQAGRLPGIDE